MDETEDEMSNGFTVFALFYGDHTLLARRCLHSITRAIDRSLVHSVRVALNACSEATREYVYTKLEAIGVPVLIYDSEVNRLKYPMMRKMFYDPARPVTTTGMMWFDDDSMIADTRKEWWAETNTALLAADMIGDLWRMKLTGSQVLGIRNQKWYTGLPIGPGYKTTFATGGWWAAKTRIIQKWDYPFKDIHHNGGDVVLGEMLRQQGLQLKPYKHGLWINADENGSNSKAPRRGESRRPVWYAFDATAKPDYSHHDFEIEPYALGPGAVMRLT